MQAYAQRIWGCRFFWLSLVRSDLRARYRRSVLGLGWSLLNPIAMTAVLCTVFHGLFSVDLKEFAPYLLSGLAFWGFISATVVGGCSCFTSGESYIRQFPAPMAIYPLRTVLGGGFHFLMAFFVALILTWTLQGFGNLAALWSLVPIFCLLLVIGWSLAVLSGLVQVHFPDSQHLLEVGIQMLFYLTPIMYPRHLLEQKGMSWLVDLNPLASLVELIRAPMLRGELPATHFILTSLVLAAITTSAAGMALVRLERRLIFHL